MVQTGVLCHISAALHEFAVVSSLSGLPGEAVISAKHAHVGQSRITLHVVGNWQILENFKTRLSSNLLLFRLFTIMQQIQSVWSLMHHCIAWHYNTIKHYQSYILSHSKTVLCAINCTCPILPSSAQKEHCNTNVNMHVMTENGHLCSTVKRKHQ